MNSNQKLLLSVIIPVRNRETDLAECLRALNASTPPPHEIIVVDDASTDNTATIAAQLGATVIRLDTNHNPNYCRNRGAQEANGDILMFLDSDVIAQPESLQNAVAAFADADVDAVVGLYTVQHRHKLVASQYKNLWIRYSYLRSNTKLDWIFGAVAAIRKEAFNRAGGFDKALFMRYGGEDLEFGKRMMTTRHLIVLNPSVEVEHLKRHTLFSLLKNDFQRSQGFVRLAGKLGQLRNSLTKGFVNVYPNFVHSVPLSWAIVSTTAAAIVSPQWLWLTLIGLIVYISLNAPFLGYYAKLRGVPEMLQALGLLFLDHLTCGIGSLKGLTQWLRSR